MRSGPLCALLWRILTWCTRKQVTLKARHFPGWLNVVADKLSWLGQTIQTEWSLLPEVFRTICSKWHWPKIDLFATRFNKLPLCHRYRIPWPQQWMLSVFHGRIWTHIPSQQQPYWAKWWRSCRTAHARELFWCSGVVQHALVLGSSGHIQPNPTEFAQSAQPVDTALQSDPSQKSNKPKCPCMAPRASAIKEQGFSEAVAARIQAPQRGSTRSVFEVSGPFLQSGASAIRRTSGHPL